MYFQSQSSCLLDQQLQQMICEARCFPSGHFHRQQMLTAIIRRIVQSKKLWKEDTPYYADALQQTWLYFCQNICEANTGDRYDFTRGSVITWLNHYLRWRLQDLRTQEYQHQRRMFSGQYHGHLVDYLPAQPDVPPILEQTRTWAFQDSGRELRQVHVRNRPDITAQVLILMRLPPETRWETLAVEFNLSVSTLSSFYQRQCLPLLRKFGQTQGYL